MYSSYVLGKFVLQEFVFVPGWAPIPFRSWTFSDIEISIFVSGKLVISFWKRVSVSFAKSLSVAVQFIFVFAMFVFVSGNLFSRSSFPF